MLEFLTVTQVSKDWRENHSYDCDSGRTMNHCSVQGASWFCSTP